MDSRKQQGLTGGEQQAEGSSSKQEELRHRGEQDPSRKEQEKDRTASGKVGNTDGSRLALLEEGNAQ